MAVHCGNDLDAAFLPLLKYPSNALRCSPKPEANMHRREFITLIGGTAAAWPLALRAQQAKVYRVGVLLLGNADADSFETAMREGLGKSGYVENQNLRFEFRSAEGKLDLLPGLAAELVALKVDVIVA